MAGRLRPLLVAHGGCALAQLRLLRQQGGRNHADVRVAQQRSAAMAFIVISLLAAADRGEAALCAADRAQASTACCGVFVVCLTEE